MEEAFESPQLRLNLCYGAMRSCARELRERCRVPALLTHAEVKAMIPVLVSLFKSGITAGPLSVGFDTAATALDALLLISTCQRHDDLLMGPGCWTYLEGSVGGPLGGKAIAILNNMAARRHNHERLLDGLDDILDDLCIMLTTAPPATVLCVIQYLSKLFARMDADTFNALESDDFDGLIHTLVLVLSSVTASSMVKDSALQTLGWILLEDRKRDEEQVRENHLRMRNAGCLVAVANLLASTSTAETTVACAIGFLRKCIKEQECRDAMRNEGLPQGLIEKLSSAQYSHAELASEALADLLGYEDMMKSILSAYSNAKPQDYVFTRLTKGLKAGARKWLEEAADSDDIEAVRTALVVTEATAVEVAAREGSLQRLEELQAEAARQARRDALGIAFVSTPDEFLCPITRMKMINPVVTSDGHTYERDAILKVIEGDDARSPISREPLDKNVLIPNLALRSRIARYADEVLDVAEAVAAASSAASSQADCTTDVASSARSTGKRPATSPIHLDHAVMGGPRRVRRIMGP